MSEPNSVPQTAEQINRPKTGQVSITPTNQVVRRQNPVSAKAAEPQQWGLRAIVDTRENVIEAVNSAAFVPEPVKAMLIDAIEKSHPAARLLRVDAHCQVMVMPGGKTKHVGCWDITEV